MGFLWFGQKQETEEQETLPTNLDELDKSFKLLQSTAHSVSSAATETARYLQEELELTKYRFFSVIDSMVDLVIIKDKDNHWITSNYYANKILNLKLKDYYKKTNEQIGQLPHIREEDLRMDSESDNYAWKVGESINIVQQLTCNDCVRYFDIKKTPTYYDEHRLHPKELIIIGRDITRLRETQEYERLLTHALDQASDIILIISNTGNITYCNNAFLSAYKYDRMEQVVGNPISIIKSGVHSLEFWSDLWNQLEKNIPWNGILTNKDNNGNHINLQTHIIPVMNGLPKPVYYISIMKLT